MKKKLITIILMAAMAASLVACGDNGPQNAIEYGDIEDKSESSENSEEIISEAGLPTYDPLSATKAMEYGNDWKLEEKTSYYKDQLESRARRAFESIYYAAENMLGSVDLTNGSQTISPAELENVMHIIFLDCPELFWLDTTFSYTTAGDYVTSVNLYYVMEENEIASIKEKNAKAKPQYIELMKKNDYDSIKSILQEITDSIDSWETVGINTDGSYDFSSSNPFIGRKSNSISTSKIITYWLRQCGIECTVAVGEPVSSTLENDYELVADFINFKEVHQDSEQSYTVRFNYPYYWMWNIVKIDDQWYNLDFAYSKLLKGIEKAPYGEDTMWFSTDLMMSQTRLSYMNEEILGIMPSCTDINFQSSYRNGSYILSLTETQALRKLQEIIYTCDSENKKQVVYQCQDEQTFNYLIANLDEQIDNYNNTYNNPIGSYKTLFVRDNLTISIYDIIYNF